MLWDINVGEPDDMMLVGRVNEVKVRCLSVCVSLEKF